MLHLWNYGTKKSLGEGRMGVFYSSLLSPWGIYSSAKIRDQGLHPDMEQGQKTCCWMKYLRGTWKSWREGSSSKETDRMTCWAMRRGTIFELQRGNCVWYLQHQHPLLDMLRGFVSSQDIALLQLGEIERDPLSPAGHNLSRRHKGMWATKASLLLPAPRKVGSALVTGHFIHTHQTWNGNPGCCRARAENTKYYSKTDAFARG